MKKMIKYIIADILRSRIVIAYTLVLLAISLSVFAIEDNPAKGILSLLNIVLSIVPLVSIIFSTIYIYNSSEFIELLVSQPLQRKTIWLSMFAGLAMSLSLSFVAGAGIAILIYAGSVTGLIMIASGILLSVIFVAISLLASVKIRDKAKGIGVAIMLWLYFAMLFDTLVLFLLFQFSDYPIEKGMVALTALNPVDLSRVLILLRIDVSAMMGYTGAVFRQFFGSGSGMLVALAVMLLWIVVPLRISTTRFKNKDL
ncbi:MAG TPA: ABC transporter permease subunit [Dyadobacter sp.]|nr:ABC transporter permease subunit [Dyadobacter sp.]